ncbi:TetR/AcrR family transcriptional regulator [Chryseobacterium suipulveris]|uniref:TetR/AcrR family transcriptional regulator n=1 Tax=Chryseobacterium suipulveris TaxID=2929800 RepID=A0ABY4BNN0_9FLAO|nr:TetR/AcrR family transcriptional regulator [Chryseobacterium suipulveris]UOE39857.1 TetR/AcrR family transcriptional regulator [Chryseobacterium suipulveris]
MDKDFLHKVSELFIENGAKTLTMDEIAREFSISKKTLYQNYANKEALLEDVLKYNLDNIIEKIAELDIKVENAIERMFCRDEHIERAVESNNSLLIKQLIKYYPAIFNSHMLAFADKFVAVLEHNVQRGREQGFYRKDFDAKVYASVFFQVMMSYHNSMFIDTAEISMEKFRMVVMDFYMNAITTEKGKTELKKYNLK